MAKDAGGSSRGGAVEALLRRLEPRIVELFERHHISPGDAGEMLEEGLTLLVYRWDEITRPDIWLIELLETRVNRVTALRLRQVEADTPPS